MRTVRGLIGEIHGRPGLSAMTTATPRKHPGRRGAKGREKLIAATMELIAERGYAGTTVNQICKRAGIAKTALYWHFGDRDGLMRVIIDHMTEGFIGDIRASVFLVGTPQQRKARMMEGLRAMIVDRPHRFRALILAVVEREDPDPYFRDACWRVTQNAIQAIADGYRASLGIDLPDMDLFAHSVIAFLVQALRVRLMNPEGEDLDRLFEDFGRTMDLMIKDRIRRYTEAARHQGLAEGSVT